MHTRAVWGVFVAQTGEWKGAKRYCTAWDWGADGIFGKRGL